MNWVTFATIIAYWGNREFIFLPKYANDASEDLEAEEKKDDEEGEEEEENHDDGDKYKEDGGND